MRRRPRNVERTTRRDEDAPRGSASERSPRLERSIKAGALALLTIALPRLAEACAVCFGDPEAPQRVGASYAVLFLVGVTVAMLGGFATFFLVLKKRAREAGARDDGMLARREESLA